MEIDLLLVDVFQRTAAGAFPPGERLFTKVGDAFFARLPRAFTAAAMVELAAVIALENFRSKFNPVFGIESGESCALPWVRDASATAAAKLR